MYYEWDWEKAERLFQRALELNPNLSETHYQYAWYLALFDRLDEAIEEHKIARDLDPLRPLLYAWLGAIYGNAGRYAEAVAEARKALELNPDFGPSYVVLARYYSHYALHEQAVAAAQRAAELVPGAGIPLLGRTYALAGRRDEALEIAAELDQKPNVRTFYVAPLYLALGDKEGALRALEAGYEAHYPGLPWVRVRSHPCDALRGDPRFADLLRRMNLPL
jgi:tetratricopeptide (TPR) repeat protein